MSAKLTQRQQEVLDYVKSEMEEGNVPTYDCIAERFGFSSTAARDHIDTLAEKNCLSLHLFRKYGLKEPLKQPDVKKSIVLDRLGYNPNFSDVKRELFEVPIYDPILEDPPFFEDENVLGILAIPYELVRYFVDECIAFKYNSESMWGSGFTQGDVIVAKKSRIAASNDIVLANVRGQNVLRRIFFQGTHVTLLSNTMGVDPQSYVMEDVKILCIYQGLYRWKK